MRKRKEILYTDELNFANPQSLGFVNEVDGETVSMDFGWGTSPPHSPEAMLFHKDAETGSVFSILIPREVLVEAVMNGWYFQSKESLN